MKTITTDQAPEAIGPYSQAIIQGDKVYCSGQIGLDPNSGSLVGEGIKKQTTQTLKNIRAILQATGRSMKHVVKTQLYLHSLDEYNTVNEVYQQFFSSPYPARSCVEVDQLPRQALIEIDCIAHLQ